MVLLTHTVLDINTMHYRRKLILPLDHKGSLARQGSNL